MAAEVGASAAAQQQIALPPEGSDITNIQDEDLLRRMWQATEDFGRKKEIRARMYKLREQRLKEFYTTGEVLSDLMSTTIDGSTNTTEGSANNAGVGSTIVTTRRTTYAASESGDSMGGGGLVVTTTETIRGGGGSQESLVIRYQTGGNEEENLKNIEMDRRQLQGSSELIYESGGKTTRSTRSTMSSSNNQTASMITKGATYGLHSQSLADQGFLTMKSKEIRDSESPTRDFSHLHNRQIQHTSSATQGHPAGGGGYWYEESRTYHTGDDGAEVVQYGSRGGQQGYSSSSVIEYGDGGNTTLRTGESAMTSENREQKSKSTKTEENSSYQEQSASSSYSFSSSNKSTQEWIQKHQDDESFVGQQTQPLQIESVRSGGYEGKVVREKDSVDETTSVHREQTSKTERVSEKSENDMRISKEERTTTEKVDEVESKEETRGPKQKVTQRSKTGELPLEVTVTKYVTTEVTTSVPSTATSTPLPDSGPTPDVGSWTVVSGKQNGVCSSTDEFVFRSGTTTSESTTKDTTQKITTSDTTTKEDSTVTMETQQTTPALSPTAKPSYSMPAAGKPTPVDSPVTSPSVEVKSIMKQTTTTTTTTSSPQAPAQSGYYIQTKRISTEVSPTHDAFARSLRASPEKTQIYTRASSKTSIDTNTTILSSPTRQQRTSVTSPTGRSSSPERGSSRPRDRSSPMKQQTPSPSASKEKRKLSSSLSKGVGGKRTATPGASPSASPVRGRSPCTDDEETRRRAATSPEKKKSTVTREGSPYSEPSRKSPGKETKPSARKTPEKSPPRETPDSPHESPKQRRTTETVVTKETKTTTNSVGRRPSKGPKDERPIIKKPSTDRLSSPASSPMKDKSPEFPKEKKPGDDKTPTSPQRPKDLDLKTRPTSGTRQTTPSSPFEKTPTKPKDHEKPTEDKRRPSKDSTEPLKTSPIDQEGPKPHRIVKADQPEEEFEVVCEAPETFDVTIITPIVHSIELPTEELGKKIPIKKATTTEEERRGKKIVQELEIERIKKPSAIPVPEPTEEKDSPYQPRDKSPVTSEIKPEKGSFSPRKPEDDYEDETVPPRTKSPDLRPTRKDSQPKKSPSKEALAPSKITQSKPSPSPSKEFPSRNESPSPVREASKSPRRSPVRDSPSKDTQRRQSPSPSRDSPLRDTKRPTSPKPSAYSFTPNRKSPTEDSPRAPMPSPATETQRKRPQSPTRAAPSTDLRRSPIRDSPRKKSPSPAKESPKSHSPSPARGSPARASPARDSPARASPARDSPTRGSPARGSPARDSPVRGSPRKHSPSPAKESTKTYSPTRKPSTRESPIRESVRKHSPSPAKESPERGYPRRHSPSPAKDSPKRKSPARESPLRESPRKHSTSPARDSPSKRPVGKSPQRDVVRKSPSRDVPTKPSAEREHPFGRRPDDKARPEKSPIRKPSVKDSPKKEPSYARKTPERDGTGASPVRQSPLRDTTRKTPDRETPKKAPSRISPTKDAPKRDSPPKKPCEHEPPKKPTLTRKASEKDKVIPKRDTVARRSQSTEIPAAKRASPFKDSPKTDDIPQRRAPSAESPTRKSPSKETPVRRIPQYSSPARQPTDTSTAESPNADKPWRQSPYRSPTKDTPSTETPARTPIKEYPPSGIPRTMSPGRRPVTTDSLPSSPDSPRKKEGRPQTCTSSPEKSPPTQRPSRSPERSPIRKHPEGTTPKTGSKPISRIPGRAPGSNITPPTQKRPAPTTSIPSYTSPLKRGPKDECCPHHHGDFPKAEHKVPVSKPQPGSRIPESHVRRPGESPVGRKPTKAVTTTTRKPKKPRKQRPFNGTESEEEEVSTSETDEDEKRECVEERVTVREKELRRVSEVFVQDMSKPHYPMQNGGFADRPVSLSLITTSTKTVTSGEEVQQTIDSEGNVTTTTYQQPSTITMSVSCKNSDYDGTEVTRTVKKTTYPDRPDEDEDVEIMEIDDDDFIKQTQAIEYPSDEEPVKRPSKVDIPKKVPNQGSPKRFGSPAKPIKKETRPQTVPGKRPTVESAVGRQPIIGEPAKKRIPTTTASPTLKKTTPVAKHPTQPIAYIPEDRSSPKSQRKPGQISRLPAKQSPKPETKKIPTTTGKTTVQQSKTTMMSSVSSTTRQQSNYVSSTMQKTPSRQPLKGAPQPKQLKPTAKGKIPQKTGKGIPVKESKKVTNGRVPYSEEPEDDEETEEEFVDKESLIASDIEKTEKYFTDEEVLIDEKVTDVVTESKITPKTTEGKPQGLHPSSAVSTTSGIQTTTTEIRQVSRESTPDAPGRRPRYADRVSEPDDDDLYYDEKGTTKITRRDERTDKKTVDQFDRTINVTMPRLETVEQRYEEEEELSEYEKIEVERRRHVRTEQVTDLDDDEPKPGDEDEIEPANLSVASKVSRFLTASATAAAPPQPSQAPKIVEPRATRRPSWEPEDSHKQPKGDEVDQKVYKSEETSSIAVKRARDIFETIAKTPSGPETTSTTPKLKTDVLGKASLFETKQVDEINRTRTIQRLRKSFTGSDESLGDDGLPKEKPCTDYTESEEDYEDEPIEQVKESPIKKTLPKDITPSYKPQFEKEPLRESSPGRTFKTQPDKDRPKEASPSRSYKPQSEREVPKESVRRPSKPSAEKPEATKEEPSYRDDLYDEPSDGELPEERKPKKSTPYEASPKPKEATSPKTTDTDATRRRNIFRNGSAPTEEDQSPKVKKTSVGSGMGREAFLKRMSKFASTEETTTVQTVRETPKLKTVNKFSSSKPSEDEPARRPSKDLQSPSRKPSTDSPTRRISREEPEYRRSPARDAPKSTDTYTRRPSRDQPRGDLESPRRTPTRETPSQPGDSPRRTDTYTRKTSKEIPRNDLESPRRTPTRDTQQTETPRRPSSDTFTRKPSRDRPIGDAESPRRTPTRETPTQPRKPQDERRPSSDVARRLSREFPKEDTIPKDDKPKVGTFTRRPSKDRVREDETPKRPQDGTLTRKPKTYEDDSPRVEDGYPRGADTFTRRPSKDRVREDETPKKPQDGTLTRKPKTYEDDSPRVEDGYPRGADTFTRRPSKDRVREDETPKRPQDGTFTRKPKTYEDDSPRVEDGYPKGTDTFTRRPSKDGQSPKRDSPMRAPEEDSPRRTGTYTRKTSTERFKESSPSPRSSPSREIQPKRPDDSPRRPSQDRPEDDKPRGSDTFTRRRSQPREEEAKKPGSAADALKPYLRTRTQELEDDKKLKPEDKTPKKLNSSRFETFTKRDSSTTVTKDDTKRLSPAGADRTPKKLSGSRFDTFTKRDSATSVKTTESVVSRIKSTTSTTRKSVEREVETREYKPEYDEPIRKAPTESPSRIDRRTPESTPERRPSEKTDRRTPDRRTPDRRTPDRKTPDRREESPASYGEPARKKPTKEVEEEPVRKAPRPEDEEVEPRTSTRRRPSKDGSPRPEPKAEEEIPDQQRRRSSGGKFGVVLRQLSSVGSRVEALMSKVEKRGSTTVTTTVTPTKRRPSKGPDSGLEIEEIFELEFLEQMLEKATDYDQRRRIRAQIRIVRRGEGRPEAAKEPSREAPRESAPYNRVKPSAPPEEPDVEEERKGKPRRPSQTRESPEKVPSLTRKPSRAEEVGGELTSPSVVAKLLPAPTSGAGASPRPAPPSTAVPKKNSLTSSSGLPREACPTDSITSSYGVGPTDESGRPLFGLRALRRPQQQPPDAVPSAPAPSPITQSRETSLEPRPQSPDNSDVRDSSGRPLFGLRAITISSTSKTTKEGSRVIERSKSPETGERPGSQSPSEDEEESRPRKVMPSTSTASTAETSVHLRDLVRRHEQHARGNVPSQPVAPLQKPRAKLRDSFILPQQSLDDEEEDVVEEGRPAESKTFPSALPSSVTESGKIVSERSCTLKSIIQKHEKNTDTEISNDKLNRRDSGLGAYTGQRPETTTVKVTSDVVRRPGILKKPKDTEVTETSTASSTSSTVRSQQSVSEKSGYVSLKKDVIQSVEDSEGAVDDEEEEMVTVSSGKGRVAKGSPGRRPSNDQGEEAPSSRATYSSYTTSSSSVARSGGEVERRSSNSTPYRVDEDDGDSNDGIEVIRSPSENRYISTTTMVTRRVVSGSESPKMVTTTTTVKKATGKPDEEETEVLVQDSRNSSMRKKFEGTSTASPSPSATFPRVTRGGSVRALSQKFQQAAGTKTTVGEVVERRSVTTTSSSTRGASGVQKDDSGNEYSQQIRRRSVEKDRGSSPTSSRRSTEVTTVSRSRQPIVDEYEDDEVVHGAGETVTVEQRSVVVTNGSTGSQGRSFLGNQSKVTGVQDVLSRMREADNEGPTEGDTAEDSEARALLNKFLGAQMILQGMEPLINAQSPSLVRQVEKQRVQKKQESVPIVYSPDINLEGIWDERRLRQLLESCSDCDERRKIRARIRKVMAEQKVTAEIVAEGRLEAEREESSGRSKAIVSKQSDDGQMETSTTVLRSVQGHSEATSMSSSTESSVTKTEVHTKTSNYSATVTGKSRVSKAPPSKTMSPFAKFKQLDEQNAGSSPKISK